MKRRTFIASTAALAALGLPNPALALFGIDIGDVSLGSGDSGGISVTNLIEGGERIIDSFEDITPEQEYYIGRSVAAVILSQYPAYENKLATRYLTLLGSAAALASTRPDTFGGYSFQLLDTDEVNALSAPGGFIFVSRGLVRCCPGEDALAAVLAHEVAHVAMQHGLQAIQQTRLTSGLSILASEGASLAGGNLGAVTDAFGGAVLDVTTTMIDSGYSRSQEYEADEAAIATMQRLGYAPGALVDTLAVMQATFTEESGGFAKTHPAPEDRIEEARDIIGSDPTPPSPAVRAARFGAAMKDV